MQNNKAVYQRSNKSRQPMFTVSAGLLDQKHVRAMGTAVWEYLVLLDWQTSEDGSVRGGYRVTVQDLAERTGHSLDTTYRNLARLESHNYIKREDVSASGWKITINKPKKWFSERRKNAKEQPQICGTDSQKCDGSNKEVQIQTNTRGSGAKAPPGFSCSHGDCKDQTYHADRVVAEAQELEFPTDIGNLPRWLKESKPLAKYPDVQLAEFVRYRLWRDGDKWENQPLRPAYVSEDIGPYLRNQKARSKPNGHDRGYWVSDRELDRRTQAGGQS